MNGCPQRELDALIAKRHWAASLSAAAEREYADKLKAEIQRELDDHTRQARRNGDSSPETGV